MSETFLSNLVGIKDVKRFEALSPFSPRVPASPGEADPFQAELIKALEAGARMSRPGRIVADLGTKMAGIIDRISNSWDMEERRSLALLYRDAVVRALDDAGFKVKESREADKIVVGGQAYDILSSLNTPGARCSSQFLKIDLTSGVGSGGPVGATRPAREIVYSIGNANGELISKINASTTMDERLGYCNQLRDKIIEALKDAGHSAYEIGKPDKVVINGMIYDVLRASRGLGENTAIQYLEVGPVEGSDSDLSSAIFAVGSSGLNILRQISALYDLTQRRDLARDFQQLMVNGLNSKGYNASLHEDPDKIVLNGTTYDVIRTLNTPGSKALLQALKVV